MADRTAPKSVNYLKNNGFKLTINKIPNVNFYIQEANIPSVEVDYVETKSIYARPNMQTGGRITYGSLNVSFIVDEDMTNYIELFNWINSEVPVTTLNQVVKPTERYDDGSLIVLNNSFRPNLKVSFETLFPVRLDEIGFDLTTTDPDPIIIGAEFKFNGMKITKL
jgi:hypothetical protein